MTSSGNRLIAKNTLLLYGRMLFIMFVTLYTSRVILAGLGVEDYGTYQAVGGIVSLLSFINVVLSTGTSRFLTYELGKGDKDMLSRVFCTALNSHVLLSLLIVLIAETLGLWFLNNKLNIPEESISAAGMVFQFSILTSIVNITQVPYTASIISHEKMDIYAYMSILEVSLKLLVAYVISKITSDKLVIYSFLLFLTYLIVALSYRFYAIRNFEETRFRFVFDKTIFKEIFSFSGWTLLSQLGSTGTTYGFTLLANMFFGPTVVTARSLSAQVSMAATQFVNNFRTAINPQIVKRLAAGDDNGSRNLVLESTKYSFFLMYLMALPMVLLAEPLLKLWLGQVPEYSVIFLQLTVIQSLFGVIYTSLYSALYSKGNIKSIAIATATVDFTCLTCVYILFKLGFDPGTMLWIDLMGYIILSIIIIPLIVKKVANYYLSSIYKILATCLAVVVISAPLIIIINDLLSVKFSIIPYFVLTILFSVIFTCTAVFFIGISKEMRWKFLNFIIKRK